PVGTREEVRLEDRLQDQFQGSLDHPVADRVDSQVADLAARLGDPTLPHRQGPEGAGLQLGPQLRKEALQSAHVLDVVGGHAVHSGRACTLVAPHPHPPCKQEGRVADEIVQVIKPAERILRRPTGQLGLDLQYPAFGRIRDLLQLVGIHQRPPGIPASALPTCWTPSPCTRLSRARTTTGPPPHPETVSWRRACPRSRLGRPVRGRSRMVPTFPVCRSARMGALLCPDSLAVPTPQSFGTATGPEDFSDSGVGGPHVGQPRTASRPRSTRLEPVQRLRSFNRRFLTYTFWPRLPDPHRLAVPARPVVVGAASRPPRRPPGRTALSFYRTAATARRWRSCTTTRSHRTSWRTHASLEDITLHLQLPDPLVLLTHLPAQPLRLGPLGLPHPTATATATGGCRMYGPVRGRRPVAPPP